MAYDLQARFHAFRTATPDSPPTSPTTKTSFARDNEVTGSIGQEQNGGTDNIGHGDLSSDYSALIRSADPDAAWLAFGEHGNHASTPPINVPATASNEELRSYQISGPLHQSRYHELSPLEAAFQQNRRPSISFHPQVTLESGQHRPLEEPLPRLDLDTRRRNRSIIQGLSKPTRRSPLSRALSDIESINHDPYARQRFNGQIQPNRPRSTNSSPANGSRYPLLSSAVYGLERDKGQTELEQATSLTTASTASSVPSEIRTPVDSAMECLVAPMSSFSPFHHPKALDNSGMWPILPRRESAPRAKSFSFSRRDSVRQSQRQSSRRSISSMSPATAFLSKFARDDVVAEPDDEGQEVGEYVLGRKIGYGGFSVVKEAFTIEGDERVCRAVKIVRKHVTGKEDMENEQFQAEFEREVGLWRCLAHHHVLPLIAVHVTNFATYCFTQLSRGGTLFDLVRANRQGLNRELARRYTYQLASAIRYLHEDMRIVHRDIKLENCLIDLSDPNATAQGGNLLLCDFGLAEFVTEEDNQNSPDPYQHAIDGPAPRNLGGSESRTGIAGSLQYASPELILSPAGFLSRVVDMWAFGVVVHALLVGDLPFQHVFQPRVQMMILAGEWDKDALRKAAQTMGTESEVVELVHGCLDMDSESRWVISQVLDSRWLNGCQEMLEEISEGW